MTSIVSEWIAKAKADQATANREIIVDDRPNYDAVCFHAQQGVEKLLKAALVQHGAVPPKSHDLVQLFDQLRNRTDQIDLDREDLALLSAYAVEFRYPGESADRHLAEEAVAIADRIWQNIPIIT